MFTDLKWHDQGIFKNVYFIIFWTSVFLHFYNITGYCKKKFYLLPQTLIFIFFASRWRGQLEYFKNINSSWSNRLGLKYSYLSPSGCKDKKISKFKVSIPVFVFGQIHLKHKRIINQKTILEFCYRSQTMCLMTNVGDRGTPIICTICAPRPCHPPGT